MKISIVVSDGMVTAVYTNEGAFVESVEVIDLDEQNDQERADNLKAQAELLEKQSMDVNPNSTLEKIYP